MYSFFNEYKPFKCLRVNLINDKLRDITDKAQFESCLDIVIYLEEETNLLHDEGYRNFFNSNKLRIVDGITKIAFSTCSCEKLVDATNIVENVFSLLRNACIQNPQNQLSISQYGNLLATLVSLIQGILSSSFETKDQTEVELRTTRRAVQFLGNLCAGKDAPKHMVWQILKNNLKLTDLLKHHDKNIRCYSTMVFFNCLTKEAKQDVLSDHGKFVNIVTLLLQTLKNDASEWSLFSLECFLEDSSFMEVVYFSLEMEHKFLLLDLLLENLANLQEPCKIHSTNISFLVENLKNLIKAFLTTPGDINIEPMETLKHLEALCYASVVSDLSPAVRNDSSLLELLLVLLKMVHTLGKAGKNNFALVQILKSVTEYDEELSKSPFYGFKCYLIRLIANMCFESETNQNFVREADGIELILDCCNLDARNPFIIQWCVLAIRNLMKNNLNNQNRLASLSIQGSYAQSPLLNELGIKVETQDGKFELKMNP